MNYWFAAGAPSLALEDKQVAGWEVEGRRPREMTYGGLVAGLLYLTTKVHTHNLPSQSTPWRRPFFFFLPLCFPANVAAMPLLAVSVAGACTHTSLALINPSLGSILVTITGRGGGGRVLSPEPSGSSAHCTPHSISRHIFIILTLAVASERATLPPSYLAPRRHPAI